MDRLRAPLTENDPVPPTPNRLVVTPGTLSARETAFRFETGSSSICFVLIVLLRTGESTCTVKPLQLRHFYHAGLRSDFQLHIDRRHLGCRNFESVGFRLPESRRGYGDFISARIHRVKAIKAGAISLRGPDYTG